MAVSKIVYDGRALIDLTADTVTAHYDALLTQLYGDWHVLPSPEARRCKEHAAIIDLERSYTDYLAAQRAMRIDVCTRSIR